MFHSFRLLKKFPFHGNEGITNNSIWKNACPFLMNIPILFFRWASAFPLSRISWALPVWLQTLRSPRWIFWGPEVEVKLCSTHGLFVTSGRILPKSPHDFRHIFTSLHPSYCRSRSRCRPTSEQTSPHEGCYEKQRLAELVEGKKRQEQQAVHQYGSPNKHVQSVLCQQTSNNSKLHQLSKTCTII